MPTVQLLTVQQAAERLAVHPDTVRRMIDRGELAKVMVGRAVRVDERALIAFVRAAQPKLVRPEKISPGQQRAFHAKCGDLARMREQTKAEVKHAILAEASRRFSRRIESSTQLSSDEANFCLDRLEEEIDLVGDD